MREQGRLQDAGLFIAFLSAGITWLMLLDGCGQVPLITGADRCYPWTLTATIVVLAAIVMLSRSETAEDVRSVSQILPNLQNLVDFAKMKSTFSQLCQRANVDSSKVKKNVNRRLEAFENSVNEIVSGGDNSKVIDYLRLEFKHVSNQIVDESSLETRLAVKEIESEVPEMKEETLSDIIQILDLLDTASKEDEISSDELDQIVDICRTPLKLLYTIAEVQDMEEGE